MSLSLSVTNAVYEGIHGPCISEYEEMRGTMSNWLLEACDLTHELRRWRS